MQHTRFITVVPAIRTVLGVEQFDYAVPRDHNIRSGDIVRVPFRNRPQAALVIRASEESLFADKAIFLQEPRVLLRCGEILPTILRQSAQRIFVSQPTVLAAWLRRVPQRLQQIPDAIHHSAQGRLSIRHIRFLGDRWFGKNGLIEETQRHAGRILVLTPWRKRADKLSELLKASALHSDIADGIAWKTICRFATLQTSLVVATRIGAWLACVADTVLVDEPENDDYKQDDLTPRMDARWLVERCSALRPEMSVLQFSTTPRLKERDVEWRAIPTITVRHTLEPWRKRAGSPIELLSPQTIRRMEEALEAQQRIYILHPIIGERARLTCSDCGWQAICATCGFLLAHVRQDALCKRCGRRFPLPLVCESCGGSELTRGLPGKDRIASQCESYFKTARVRVVDAMDLDAVFVGSRAKNGDVVIIPDLALLGGASEDIRRRERLVIAWRRIAASVEARGGCVIAQGTEELIAACPEWLTANGLCAAWRTELEERRLFGFPPATRFVKLIVTTAYDTVAQSVTQSVRADAPQEWSVRGPYPVPFRPHTRSPRYVIHVSIPLKTSEETVGNFFHSYADQAIIDLDPVAFFN